MSRAAPNSYRLARSIANDVQSAPLLRSHPSVLADLEIFQFALKFLAHRYMNVAVLLD